MSTIFPAHRTRQPVEARQSAAGGKGFCGVFQPGEVALRPLAATRQSRADQRSGSRHRLSLSCKPWRKRAKAEPQGRPGQRNFPRRRGVPWLAATAAARSDVRGSMLKHSTKCRIKPGVEDFRKDRRNPGLRSGGPHVLSKSDLLIYTYETKPRLLRRYAISSGKCAWKKRPYGMPCPHLPSLTSSPSRSQVVELRPGRHILRVVRAPRQVPFSFFF